VEWCDFVYGNCCSRADQIEDDSARLSAFAACIREKEACENDALGRVPLEWITATLSSYVEWVDAHPYIVAGALGVGTALVVFASPVAAPVAISVLALEY
jgi:hypothetical protein